VGAVGLGDVDGGPVGIAEYGSTAAALFEQGSRLKVGLPHVVFELGHLHAFLVRICCTAPILHVSPV